MLTIIVLLTQRNRCFTFNHGEISIEFYEGPSGISAKVDILGIAAWGFNNARGDFGESLMRNVQKVLMYHAEGREELLKEYRKYLEKK